MSLRFVDITKKKPQEEATITTQPSQGGLSLEERQQILIEAQRLIAEQVKKELEKITIKPGVFLATLQLKRTQIFKRRDFGISRSFTVLEQDNIPGKLREFLIMSNDSDQSDGSNSDQFSIFLTVDGATVLQDSFTNLKEVSDSIDFIDAVTDTDNNNILVLRDIKWTRSIKLEVLIDRTNPAAITFSNIIAIWDLKLKEE